MKEKVWINPNKMLFESGHKTFDRYIVSICKGAVIGGGQRSSIIRPVNELAHGKPFEKGYLRQWDLNQFDNVPSWIRREIDERPDNVLWLYEFYHYNNGKRISHGFVLTSYEHKFIISVPWGPTYKSGCVISEAAKYVSEMK